MQRPKTRVGRHTDPLTNKGQGLYKAFGLFVVLALFISNSIAVSASTITEDFNGESSYPKGSVVSIKKGEPGDIELTDLNNSEYLLGVVADDSQSSISFKKQSSNVSVALSGEVEVLVSDANGDIVRGDFIGASWLEGVGMKAIDDEKQKLLGVAQEGLDSVKAEEYGGIDTENGRKDVSVGVIKVRLFDKESPLASASESNAVQGVLSSVVGKDVSITRAVIGSILFSVSLIVAAMFITSSVKGSFISIGRNPMASASIHKGMVRVAILSVVIIITGTAVAYAVLAL